MKSRKAKAQNKTEDRRARILSFRPQENAWNPTLEECLAMEAEETRRKQARGRVSWDDIMREIHELKAEIEQRRATA